MQIIGSNSPLLVLDRHSVVNVGVLEWSAEYCGIDLQLGQTDDGGTMCVFYIPGTSCAQFYGIDHLQRFAFDSKIIRLTRVTPL